MIGSRARVRSPILHDQGGDGSRRCVRRDGIEWLKQQINNIHYTEVHTASTKAAFTAHLDGGRRFTTGRTREVDDSRLELSETNVVHVKTDGVKFSAAVLVTV